MIYPFESLELEDPPCSLSSEFATLARGELLMSGGIVHCCPALCQKLCGLPLGTFPGASVPLSLSLSLLVPSKPHAVLTRVILVWFLSEHCSTQNPHVRLLPLFLMITSRCKNLIGIVYLFQHLLCGQAVLGTQANPSGMGWRWGKSDFQKLAGRGADSSKKVRPS